MLKKLKYFALVIPVAAMLAGCSIILPVNATSNAVGNKVGRATGTVYFGVIALDQDASIKAAAKNGGITRISTVDIKCGNILGYVIQSYETIVTGE